MRIAGTIFLIAILTLAIFAMWFAPLGQDAERLMPFMLVSCMTAYGTFLYLDIRSTMFPRQDCRRPLGGIACIPWCHQ